VAARLAEAGRSVTLFERRPVIGEELEPSFVGPSRALAALSARIGAHGDLKRTASFSLTALPVIDRVKLAARAARPPKASDFESVERWLDRLGQSAEARRRFWHPLVQAALGEEPGTASAKLLETLLDERALERVELSPRWSEAAAAFIEAQGGRVVTAAPVRALEVVDRVVRGLLLDGERIAADAVIAALGPRAIYQLTPAEERRESWFVGLDRLDRPHAAGAETLRPSVRSPIGGFFACGPSVRTGLPVAAESAARAAEEAAAAALEWVPPPPRIAPPTANATGSRRLPVVG
jgi:phytoene dehydrogenase-like protein